MPGHCTAEYYAGWDGIKDLQLCLNQCLSEEQCEYASFYAQHSCSRYKKGGKCQLNTTQFNASELYTTYQKVVQKGMTISI